MSKCLNINSNLLRFVYIHRLAVRGTVDSEFVAGIEKAVEYFNQMEQAHPSLCSRLELGYNWEDAAEKLILGCQ